MEIVVTYDINEELREKLIKSFPNYNFTFTKEVCNLSKGLLEKAEVFVTYGYDVTKERIKKMENLKWVQVMQAGVESLQFEKLIERNIMVSNVKGIQSIPMAEYAIGTMLQIVRKNYVFYEAQSKRKWDNQTTLDTLYGKTLGILGLGKNGREVAKKAKCFGMRVIGCKRSGPICKDNYIDEVILTEQKSRIFKESDFIVVLLPHTKETDCFIGDEELSLMKRSAYLINMGRGRVVDENALIKSLETNEIAGAVLDVFSNEPLPYEHPLWKMSNIIITPHVSGDRFPSHRELAIDVFCRNLKLYSENKGLENIVNLTIGY